MRGLALLESNSLNEVTTTCGFRPVLRAHDLGCLPVDELTRRVAATGAGCVQLALGKAIDGSDLKPGVLDKQLGTKPRRAFAMQGVGIEVLGCYIKPGIAVLLQETEPDQIRRCVQFIRNQSHEFFS